MSRLRASLHFRLGMKEATCILGFARSGCEKMMAARRSFGRIVVLLLAFLTVFEAGAAELKPKTIEAFHHYVQLSEQKSDAELARPWPFLWLDMLPESRRAAAYGKLHRGEVVIERLQTRDDGEPVRVPNGLIHHWIGTVFIPGATLQQTLAVIQDYNRHQDYYRPDVIDSKILSHNGNDFVVYLRFYKKKVVTSVLNTQHSIHYLPLSATREASRSRSLHIAEVEDAGGSQEHEKPIGADRGFLWRLNTYWRFEQKDGGTYAECQSISLTRDIPAGLGWIIGPYVESVPRESLSFTLSATRSAVLGSLPKN